MLVVRKILQTKILLPKELSRLMLLSNCAVCSKKKSRNFKNQETSRSKHH